MRFFFKLCNNSIMRINSVIVIFNTYLIMGLIILTCSCKKGNKFCTWPSKTIALNNYINCESNDTCNYNSLLITLWFNIEYIEENPPCGTYNDSVVGNIEHMNVFANYLIGNDTIKDTINDIVKFKINYFNGEVLHSDLSTLNTIHPRCNNYIYLSLISSTNNYCLQYFSVEYKQTDGVIYTTSTNAIYFNF